MLDLALLVALSLPAPSAAPAPAKCPASGPLGDLCQEVKTLSAQVQDLKLQVQTLSASGSCGATAAPVCCPLGEQLIRTSEGRS